MKVKITGCSHRSYWYSDKYGVEYDVEHYGDEDYRVIGEFLFISKDDCIIISKEEKMKKNCIIIDGKEIELSDETVREIKEKLGIEEKETLEWIPDNGEWYWFIDDREVIRNKVWYYSKEDGHLKTGNIYKTKEIAQQKLDDMNEEIQQTFIKIENYVRNNDDGWRVNWDDDEQRKYSIYYSHSNKSWDYTHTNRINIGTTFMSKEMADKVLEMLNGGEINVDTNTR